MAPKQIRRNVLVGITPLLIAFGCCGQPLPYSLLHSFVGSPDGDYPQGLLIVGDTLYGTTQNGGTPDHASIGNGTIFSLRLDGTAYTLPHTFTARPPGSFTNVDGILPGGELLALGTTIYGITIAGGVNTNGTLFSVTTGGVFTVLHSFSGGVNGSGSSGLLCSGDTLYGTTGNGGTFTNQYGIGFGTIFSLKTNGTDFNILHSFNANIDGESPVLGLLASDNRLYGTASLGGSGDNGTVFSINNDGTGFIVLHDFGLNKDGSHPQMPLTLSGDRLYGTTFVGGAHGYGTVFAINLNGTGFSVLHDFDGINGNYPSTPLVLAGGSLYGGTTGGGPNGGGTIFELKINNREFSVLINFDSTDSRHPLGNLALWSKTLYGTAQAGGQNNRGTVFSLELPAAPSVSTNPQNLTVTVGFPASFVVGVSGWPPFHYQWAANGTNIVGATNSSFNIANVFASDAGAYTVTITNLYGGVTSAPTMLTVAPVVLENPSEAGGKFRFSLNTASNVNYSIERSTTLTDWTPLVEFKGNGGPLTITDPNLTDPQRFYRIRLYP